MNQGLQGIFIGYIATHMTAVALALWLFFEYTKKDADAAWLRVLALLSFGNFLLSAIFSGYAYSAFYEQAVRSSVLAGPYWWAERVLTETRSYIMIFIPLVSFVVLLTMYIVSPRLLRIHRLKHVIASLMLLAVFSGVAVLLMEMGISRSAFS